MFADYHMHSDFSADCKTPMEETVQAAISKGLTEICFTDHLDYDYPDPTICFDLDVQGYDKTIKDLQKRYSDQITIKKGIEIGIQAHLHSCYEKLLAGDAFDFIICSVHTADRRALHNGDFFKGKSPSVAYQQYYEGLLDCITNFSVYSVLGHLDLVKRYQKLDVKVTFLEIIEQIFRVIIPQGKGIEVNTAGFAHGLGSAMPSNDILQLYKVCGGEVITIGSDAHHSGHVGRRIKETLYILETIGFKYIATFQDRKPTFHPIGRILSTI